MHDTTEYYTVLVQCGLGMSPSVRVLQGWRCGCISVRCASHLTVCFTGHFLDVSPSCKCFITLASDNNRTHSIVALMLLCCMYNLLHDLGQIHSNSILSREI